MLRNMLRNKNKIMFNLDKKIYLDHAATTPVDPEVLETMLPYFNEKFGNPMSLHSFGQDANQAVEKSRGQLAHFLNCQKEEIIFTSGASESNNLVLRSLAKNNSKETKPHIITTQFEHHCIFETAKILEQEGRAGVDFVIPGKDGVIDPKKVEEMIKENTILVSIIYVNNEIGTVQPIKEIGEIIKRINNSRENKIFFHTDATQAPSYFSCNAQELGADLMTLSGHKIYGPKGIGVLFAKRGILKTGIITGGGQEKKLRAGTHNVPGIVGIGKAVSVIDKNKSEEIEKITKLRDYLIEKVLKDVPDSWLNGSKEKRSPNNANFGFRNVEGESLVLMLDQAGIACSTGSACSSDSLEPSHVLLSLGLRPEEAHGSLRVTLGKNTTQEEIEYTAEKIKEVVTKLRQISGGVLEDFNK